MRQALGVRCLAGAEYSRRQAVARWQLYGHSVRLRRLEPQTRYIHFWAQSSGGIWQGVVDAHGWMHAVWPQWSQMLPQGGMYSEILELFSAVNRPLEIAPGLLDYQHLFDVELVLGESLQQAALPCFSTERGEIWVVGLPQHGTAIPRPLQQWLLAIPHSLRIVLGTSKPGQELVSQLTPGDVLFVANQTRELFMAGQCIGQFTFISEGLHLQLTPPDNTDAVETCPLSKLPVKLEFVLGELTVPLAQLNDIIERQVLPLERIDLGQVEVRAGGQRIAVGELVRLDDRLGVELHEIFRSSGNE